MKPGQLSLHHPLTVHASGLNKSNNKDSSKIDLTLPGNHFFEGNIHPITKVLNDISDIFIEYENVHGDLYGTTKEGVEHYLSEKKPLFLELDVKGALNLKKIYPEDAVSIFLSAPNFNELENRLIHRSSESKEEIEKRLSRFSEEENLKKEFDYTVINDNFESTFEELKKMILSMIKED